ncbi:MAG: macro domain-containing protein [Thermoproteota archaeon]|jgi:O-acetyl-ADP-ribose deacetylase (regulator of RNase III)|nr:macro domain-containing protein [Thermoproteota archaeon]
METYYKEVKVEIKIGDLLEENAEAIVNPANSLMIMGGGVAGAIKNKGGKEIEEEALKYAPVPIGKAIVTGAGKLKSKYVIHSPTMERPAMLTTKDKVYNATKAALEAAHIKNIKTIAFPAMGTGVGGLSFKEASEAMIKAIKDVIDSGIKFERISIILREKEAYDEFSKAIKILK